MKQEKLTSADLEQKLESAMQQVERDEDWCCESDTPTVHLVAAKRIVRRALDAVQAPEWS